MVMHDAFSDGESLYIAHNLTTGSVKTFPSYQKACDWIRRESIGNFERLTHWNRSATLSGLSAI